jgi:predicted peroxiredoxin
VKGGLSLLVWSCGPEAADRAATPFVVAQAAAALELEVEMLFTAQAVHWMLAAQQDTPVGFGADRQPVRQYVDACAGLGVQMRACSQALAGLGQGREVLATHCTGVGGVVAFVERTQDPRWRTLVF